MQRFYQGQLDFFCAAYAVINAMTALYGIDLAQGRTLLASALADISRHPALWKATLYNDTDFHWLADYMLYACSQTAAYPVTVTRPFAACREISPSALTLASAKINRAPLETVPDADSIWNAMTEWLPETTTQPKAGMAKQVVILRFHRYIRYFSQPIVSHWSMMDCHHAGIFQLRDASKEENALYSLDREVTVFTTEEISEKYQVRIEPESLYFIKRR